MAKTSQKTVNGILIVTTISDIALDKVNVLDFQKAGTKTAQLRQKVTTVSHYPNKKVDSNMQQNLFGVDAFGFDAQVFTSEENRIAFILVPADITEEKINAMLVNANKADAVIYKVLDTKPILDDNQKYAISVGNKTMDDFADAQVIRYPASHEKANQLILDKAGNPNYRRTFLWNSPKDDMDLRSVDNVYMSPAIEAEVLGAGAAFAGQKL